MTEDQDRRNLCRSPSASGETAAAERRVDAAVRRVARLAELHGGSLLIESTPGEGTSITVRFPARPVLLKRFAFEVNRVIPKGLEM
jgi:hypothetical protein